MGFGRVLSCLGMFLVGVGPSWVGFGLYRVGLGPCGLVLGHLGSFLGHAVAHFGAYSEGILWPFWGPFWGPFWDYFEVILGPILGPDRPKKGPKAAQEGHQELERPKKAAFSKTLKKHLFFQVFGVQRPPKRALGRPRRLQRVSQRGPKPQKLFKNGPQH